MILIDLYHTPQLNFFKPTILSLDPEQCLVVCLNRGKLLEIARREFPGYTIMPLGDYRFNRNFRTMVTDVILPRIKALKEIIRRHDIRFVVTANYQANVAAKQLGIPNIVFNDDPRAVVIHLAEWAADVCYVTKGIRRKKSVELNMLKEWAYLSPSIFTPNPSVLVPYGLKPYQYVFLRDVDTNTSNYYHQSELSALDLHITKWPVLLSLEDKSRMKQVPPHWIVLKEPLSDIHSKMFYSRAFLSTGDSMAREAAELGVPSAYLGTRDMLANRVLMDSGYLEQVPLDRAEAWLEGIRPEVDPDLETDVRTSKRLLLQSQWDDVNRIIREHIEPYLHR
jgi:predicted glycosyltransferase